MSGGTRFRVVIVDDHELLSQSLEFALVAAGMNVTRCTELADEHIVAAIDTIAPDVLLLDLFLDGDRGSSLHLVPPLATRGVQVAILTASRNEVLLAECVEAGAIGIIPKSEPFDRLVAAVRQIATTGTLLSSAQREEWLGSLRRHRAHEQRRLEPFERLTSSEAKVLEALMAGQSAKQIAADRFVSLTTVRTQIRTLLLKLGVSSQLAAVALAISVGWPARRAVATSPAPSRHLGRTG